MTDMTNKWCWWLEDDQHFNVEDSESSCHGAAQGRIDDECEPGEVNEYHVARVQHPMDAVGMDWIARKIGESIDESICCWCDDNTGAEETSIEMLQEDSEELGRLVAAFVREKASVNWWTADEKSKTTHTYAAGSKDANVGAA